ncbi:hypothetical protein [Legionella bononiensis]|uniref:Uncharacterized protein n=2 Tax=Legionella bononiensis TaxID=2793102 RepID=A0ABS1WB15_9GAMM|nr:hypothetical protein [Legionella bononiensis]MBL7480214.1 hypothetical protein [Legionella bononiensis]MBL7526554.1 hypothetical protein [Legionella bononiensis]MBL7562952.1 hypothetical protein [Legionella bononiensis]
MWNQSTIYYPAVCIATDQISYHLYPAVTDYDRIDSLLKLGLFKPTTPEQNNALFKHNLNHYSHSKQAKHLIETDPNLVPRLEQMAEEIDYMTDNGIAFK